LPSQLRMDRDRAGGVTKGPGTAGGSVDPWGRGRQRKRPARERHRRDINALQLPELCELKRDLHTARQRRDRVALPAHDPATVDAKPAVPDARSALHQTVLAPFCPQRRADPLAVLTRWSSDTDVGEAQRSVLDLQAAAQLSVVEERA